jgi:ribosomal-protein-alanine acetyltransferase
MRREKEAERSGMGNWRQGGIVVREAVFGDLDAIAKLERASFETDQVSLRSFRRFLRMAHRPLIAASIDGALAGYALVSLRKGARAVRIYSLAVDVRFVRRGVGYALLQACEAYARRHGRTALTLEVRYDNAPAIALYEKWGFRQIGEHAHYYSDGAAALRYERSLLPERRPARPVDSPHSEHVRPLRGRPRAGKLAREGKSRD